MQEVGDLALTQGKPHRPSSTSSTAAPSILIVCDGACSGNGKEDSPGGWGTILVYKEHYKEKSGGENKTTNNIMELTAAIQGLEALKTTHIPVRVFSDSAYVVNCFRQGWYLNWERNQWKNAQKKPVENRELWERLLVAYRRQEQVEFIKVKGHLNPDDRKTVAGWLRKLNDERSEKNLSPITEEEYQTAIRLNVRADELARGGIPPRE